MGIERNVGAADALLTDLALHLLHRRTPTLWDELFGRRTPDLLVNVYAIGVPPHPCCLGNGDLASEQGVFGCDSIDQLGDRGVQAEEFVDYGGQIGEFVDGVGGGIYNARAEYFFSQLVLYVLAIASPLSQSFRPLKAIVCYTDLSLSEFPEYGIKQLLRVLVGSKERDFEVGAVLCVVNLAFRKGVFQHVYKQVIIRVPWLSRSIAWAIFHQVIQQILKLFHDFEGPPAGGKYVWVFVQSRKVEEQWFEYCSLDDGL